MSEETSDKPDASLPEQFVTSTPEIRIGHGGGGRLMNRLIDRLIRPIFNESHLDRRHDGAVLREFSSRSDVAVTTDSYVVTPRFFPGGNIGDLAVNGTVNDLAMCGARPKCISVGLILEEGFPTEKLKKILETMKNRADQAGVRIVTGDTKVVQRDTGDGVYINTTGFGLVPPDLSVHPGRVETNDHVIINGPIAEHGMAILTEREEMEVDTELISDTMPLHHLVRDLLEEGVEIHCMRDLTRGGLTSAVVEMAEASEVGIELTENDIPIQDHVKGLCEMLGMAPEHVANEGRCVLFVQEADVKKTLEKMKVHDAAPAPAVIGSVTEDHPGTVIMQGPIGGRRILDMPGGEQLPRIC